MRRAMRTTAMLVTAIAVLTGCQGTTNDSVSPTAAPTGIEVACQTPRPEMCTMHYLPVCGLRDTGSWKTYGNACAACRNADVIGHKVGECKAAELEESK